MIASHAPSRTKENGRSQLISFSKSALASTSRVFEYRGGLTLNYDDNTSIPIMQHCVPRDNLNDTSITQEFLVAAHRLPSIESSRPLRRRRTSRTSPTGFIRRARKPRGDSAQNGRLTSMISRYELGASWMDNGLLMKSLPNAPGRPWRTRV